MIFQVAISNVLVTLLYAVPGFLLCKCKKAVAEHLSTLSSVLIYVCSPCMVISSFLNMEFTAAGFGKTALFFGVTLLLQIAFMLFLFLLFRKRYEDSKYRILTIGSVLGNVGFFGLPIVKAILPDYPEVACYSCVYVVSMNILVFTVGVFCLTNDKKAVNAKAALLNPATLSLVVALPLYFFGAKQYLPEILLNSVSLVGDMTTPLCMIILGVRLATVPLKPLFLRPYVYLTIALKLVVFPLFCYLCVVFLPLDFSFKASVLVLSAVPCASVILNMAEIHRAETELAANCVLLSTLLCFITIPLLVLLL